MDNNKQPTPLRLEDYEAIEEALMESARGRWFLTEFSRRNRTADTQVVLDAIDRLETAVGQPRGGADLMRRDLIEMSEAISRTRAEIAAIRPPRGTDSRSLTPTEELDAIVLATERATSDILAAAEAIQDTIWRLRESPVEPEICDGLEQRLNDIITACSFQDITGQRIDKVVQVLRLLETRVNSMIEMWGLDDDEIEAVQPDGTRPADPLLNGPQAEETALRQSDVDHMIAYLDRFADGDDDLDVTDVAEADDDIEAIDIPLGEDSDGAGGAPFDDDALFAPTEARENGGPRDSAPERRRAGGDDRLLPELRVEALDPVKRDALFG